LLDAGHTGWDTQSPPGSQRGKKEPRPLGDEAAIIAQVLIRVVRGELAMAITIEAIYENGVLKPAAPLPFKEHEKVQVTVQPQTAARTSPAVIPCTDEKLIEWAATDADLDYPPPPEEP
jgi:predicted DNA-binding antitoxin AbrB/MazE fold protein